MPQPTNPKSIADSLTANQARAFLAMSGKQFKSVATICRHAKLRRWPRGASYIGLIERDESHYWNYRVRLSAIGLAVKAHILKESQS